MPVVELIGDRIENYYQLGLKDKFASEALIKDSKNLLKTPLAPLNFLIEEGIKQLTYLKLNNSSFWKKVEAYSEGLGMNTSDVLACLVFPEFASSVNKWAKLPTPPLACSSFFAKDKKSGFPLHGRIFDFPLKGSFDQNERILKTKFTKAPQIISFGSAGFPFHGITAMTEHGITLSLHQKFSEVFEFDGTPIFEIIENLLEHATSLEEAQEILQQEKSITTWCLNLTSLKNPNEILTYDIAGSQHYFVRKELNDEIVYLNNVPLNSKPERQLSPYGMPEYNRLREKNAKLKIKKFSKKEFKLIDMAKLIGTPLPLAASQKIEAFDTITPSTLHSVAMSCHEQSFICIAGPTPKFFDNGQFHGTNCFEKLNVSLEIPKKESIPASYKSGLEHLMLAQKFYEKSDIHETYHQLQMAIDCLDEFQEKHLAEFFFCVVQFLHEPSKRMLSHTYQKLNDLKPLLHSNLKDHCHLFLWRIERILNLAHTVSENDIENDIYQKLIQKELKIPSLLFQMIIRQSVMIRIDLWDIIYLHS